MIMKIFYLLVSIAVCNCHFVLAQKAKPSSPKTAIKSSQPATLKVGMKAPKLEAVEWFSEKPKIGNRFVALDFWGPTCKPCIGGFAHVNELQKKYKDKIAFIATTTDEPEPIYLYDGPPIEFSSVYVKSWEPYSVTGIPHMIIIDPKGIVRFSGNGHDVTEQMLEGIFKQYGN